MAYYHRIKKAYDTMMLAEIIGREDWLLKANGDLTQVVREICGLD